MRKLVVSFLLLFGASSYAQSQVGDKLGGWYMYFWNTEIKESGFGFQGDMQLRNWNVMGDLEQLLMRAGFTYSPKKDKIKFYKYARGSVYESLDWLEKAKTRGLIEIKQYDYIFSNLKSLPRETNHLICYTESKLTV